MKRSEGNRDKDSHAYLLDVLAAEFGNTFPLHDLVSEFLRCDAYRRDFASKLINAARGDNKQPWEIRRLAVLMLEHLILKLPADDTEEYDHLFTQLNLKSAQGASSEVDDSVLKEGFSTTGLTAFIVEFRRRLERLNRIHAGIKGDQSSAAALRDFARLSRQDCKLYLARYLFTPEEVVNQILKQTRTSKGISNPEPFSIPWVKKEAEHTLSVLPEYEARILRLLCDGTRIFWVSGSTSSEINSLVEYPLTTVALVVKPPGSDIEIQFKRAGRTGIHPLNVVYQRNGTLVPAHHRLDAGSLNRHLLWETQQSNTIAWIYRLVHHVEPPVCRALSLLSIYTVPARNGDTHILDYFSTAEAFGEGFREMQANMRKVVDAYSKESKAEPMNLPADLGLAVEFLSYSAPSQIILFGSSSFRVDKLAGYLSGRGPEKYFEEGLQVGYTEQDEKWLADNILEEVLGLYLPPQVEYLSYDQYVREAFSVEANRARADQNYLCALRQIGMIWGVVVALRGYSYGESFVDRNVGLKSCWDSGQWKVRIIFMDHDNLYMIGSHHQNFHPQSVIRATTSDERFIRGPMQPSDTAKSAFHWLKQIYRVSESMVTQGQSLFHKSLEESYRKTQDAILNNSELKKLLPDSFPEQSQDWDIIVDNYLKMRTAPSGIDDWKEEATKFLGSKGYAQGLIEEHLLAVEKYSDFLARYAFLYERKNLPLSSS